MSNVVFQRDDGQSHDDVWDDSELLKMYDNGLQLSYQIAMAETANESVDADVKPEETACSKEADTKLAAEDEVEVSSDKSSTEIKIKWKKGDKCYGLFKEDQLMYPATIMDVRVSGSQVKYKIHYSEFDRRDDSSYAELTGEELMTEVEGHQYINATTFADQAKAEKEQEAKAKKTKPQKPVKAETDINPNVQSLLRSFSQSQSKTPSPPPPAVAAQPTAAAPPQQTPAAPASIPNSLAAFIPQGVYPPNVFQSLTPSSTDEALSNYLTSTYMNGYHAGYYQALQDMAKKAAQ